MSTAKATILRTFKISPESALKLKFLNVSTGETMSHLLELMIEREWAEKSDYVAESLTSQKRDKHTSKVLKRIKPK